jgi:predicted DNA-binding transcriptional regulator AlpA
MHTIAAKVTPHHRLETTEKVTNEKAIPTALKHLDYLPDSANVLQPVVQGLYSCSAATIWRQVKAGHIPAPTRFAERVTAWNDGELRRALKNAKV